MQCNRIPFTYFIYIQYINIISMQIEPDLFKWLMSLSLLKQSKRSPSNLVLIPDQKADKLTSGYFVGLILKALLPKKADLAPNLLQEVTKKIELIKDNNTPAVRIYNWNILVEVIAKVWKHVIEAAQKSSIVSTEPQPLLRILRYLHDSTKNSLSDPKQKQTLKIDLKQLPKRTPKETTNIFQYLILVLSRHFKLSPQQTLNLFLDSNKYLSHLMVKGVKGTYNPIYSFLEEIRKDVDFIVLQLFCIDEEENVIFLLNAIKSGFISNDATVAELCCQLMTEFFDTYKINAISIQSFRNWLKSDNNSGLNTFFFSIKKFRHLFPTLLDICHNYLDDELFKSFKLNEKSILYNTDHQKLVFYKNLISQSNKQLMDKFCIHGGFEEWNRFIAKVMKKTKDNDQGLICMSIMEEQWIKLGERFEEHEMGLPHIFTTFLKGMSESSNQLMFIQSNRTLFSLMEILGQVKNPFAPIIYKNLISNFNNSKQDERVIFISENFVQSFRSISTLPGGPLVVPLLRQLQSKVEYSLLLLADVLLEESRISIPEATQLIEMLGKVIFQNASYGELAMDVTFKHLQQMNKHFIESFFDTYAKLSLAQIYGSAKAISKKLTDLKNQLKRSEANPKLTENYISQIAKYILNSNLVKFLKECLVHSQQIKEKMEQPIFTTYIKLIKQLRKPQIAQILKPTMAVYYPQEDELQYQIKYHMNLLYPPEPPKPAKENSVLLVKQERSIHKLLIKSVTEEPEPAYIDPSSLKPTEYAIKDLEKVKQKRYDMKTLELERQKQKEKKTQKMQKFKSIMYEKRMIESMSSSIKNEVHDFQYQSLVIDKKQEKPQNIFLGAPQIRLLHLQTQQEVTYQEDAENVMKKYKKVWKYLFYKYSSVKSKQESNKNEEKMFMGEVWKMMKQYDLFPHLKKQECYTLVRLVNEHMKRKNDPQNLTAQGFQDYILQICNYGFSKKYPHVPPGQQMILLIDQLKKVTKQKSGSIEIFENPEEAYFQETEVVREYNRRLKQNPDYILPEGYKKIKQTFTQFEYNVHPMQQTNISNSYIDVLEVLDLIFSERPELGFRIIQPISIKNQKLLARPVLFQNMNEKMKDYKQGYLLPKTIEKKSEKNIFSPPLLTKRQHRPYPNFSLGIKLGVAEISVKNKSIADEVAYCMNDILDAIENKTKRVVNKSKKITINQALKKKRVEYFREEEEKKKNEINWKKRTKSVKLQIELLREKRKEADKEKKKAEFLTRKQKKQKEERMMKIKFKQFEKVKAKIEERKEELMYLKQAEEQRIALKKEEYKQGVSQYFNKKKEELREKQAEYKRKKEEQKQKQQTLEEKKKEFVKKLWEDNQEKEEQINDKIEEIKQQYDETWNSAEVQQLFSFSRKSLKYLFDLLLKYQKSKISATNYDQIGINTLNMFCIKFKIIPFMVEKQGLHKIFNFATKVEGDKKFYKKGINYEKFQQFLFLVAVKSKKMLNQIVKKNQKKEKRMQAFMNAQKNSSGGNHFDPGEFEQSESSSQESEEEEEKNLQDDYLFNTETVNDNTVRQVILFLRLPKDKLGVEQRWKEAMESKNFKPKNVIKQQMMATLEY